MFLVCSRVSGETLSTQFTESRKESIQDQDYDRMLSSLRITMVYTDGSGFNGKVGAAAVIPSTGREASKYLGNLETEHSVYVAELQAINLALDLLITHPREPNATHIFTGNQAAIRSIRRPRTQNGQ